VTSVAVFRAKLRTFLFAVLPHPVANGGLVLWRRARWNAHVAASRRRNRVCIAGLLQSGRPINLELGSPKREGMEDWVASDIHGGGDLRLDLTDPMPFPDSSVQRIYSSHVLEHFSYPSPMLDILNCDPRIDLSRRRHESVYATGLKSSDPVPAFLLSSKPPGELRPHPGLRIGVLWHLLSC